MSRCKFPKTSDAVHELATNRNKNRTEPNLPPLPPEFASFAGRIFHIFSSFFRESFKTDFLLIFSGSQFDVRRDMFLQELKNSNNKNRLLTDKMNGTTVFKIPDELWDRSYPMFCVELLGPNIKLECRPHGFTEEDVPVYTRTGKVANKLPYPEDIVRYNCSIIFHKFGFQISFRYFIFTRIFLILSLFHIFSFFLFSQFISVFFLILFTVVMSPSRSEEFSARLGS